MHFVHRIDPRVGMRKPKVAIRQLPRGTNSEIDQRNVTEARTEGGNTIATER